MAKDGKRERSKARYSHFDNLDFILRTIVGHQRVLRKRLIRKESN